MHCPRCGTKYEQGDRFCASCGEDLRRASAATEGESRSPRERAAALIGTTRRTRLITAGTAVFIAIAIAAFIALDPDDEIPRDRYTIAADRICVEAKREIAAAGARSLGEEPGAYASQLVPIVTQWRSDFNSLDLPADRAEEARALDAALQRVEVESAALARLGREGSRQEVVEKARQVDELTTGVEETIGSLNLDRCARLTLGQQPAEPE